MGVVQIQYPADPIVECSTRTKNLQKILESSNGTSLTTVLLQYLIIQLF